MVGTEASTSWQDYQPTKESLVQALYRMAAAHGLDVGARAARAAVASAGIGVERPWQERLADAADTVGLTLVSVAAPLEEILGSVTPGTPWVTIVEPMGSPGGLLVVLDAARDRVRIAGDGAGIEGGDGWVALTDLLALLQVESPRARVAWLTGEPTVPLDVMRSPLGQGDGDWSGRPGQRLRALLRIERRDLAVVVVYSVVIGLLSLVLPIAVQSLVNTVAFGNVLQPLVVLTLVVLAALGFSAAMSGFRLVVVEIIQRRVFARVAADFTQRLIRARAEAFDGHHGPELVNRFFDVATVQKNGALLIIDGLSLGMQTLVGLLVLALYHPLLLVFDIVLVLVMLYILFGLGRGAVKTAITESKVKYSTAAWLEEVASNPMTFKSLGGARYAAARSDALVREYLLRRKAHFRIFVRQVMGSLALQAVASAALLGIGGWLVIQRQLTLGQLVAAELIVTVAVSGFAKFGKKLETYYDLTAAIDKLGQVIDLPLERHTGEHLPASESPAGIQLQSASFSFPGGVTILDRASWSVAPGERVGLVGPSGSGKSTLADLLYGLRAPSAGLITIDGFDFRDISLPSLREQVAVVHGPGTFSGTVLENVVLGREQLSLAGAQDALREAGLLDELHALPDGLSTQLSLHGRPMSPGQVVRLMLARAIAGRPRLLILDGALDQIADRADRLELAGSLLDRAAPWTVICVTGDEEILDLCDRVCRLEHGAIIESPVGAGAVSTAEQRGDGRD
jgi:ABC-type bacteriocin/lantibiotic exporter with double-glycine peptidase domain